MINFSGIRVWSADSHVRAFLASDEVRADKAVRAPVFALVQSTLLAGLLLALFVWSAKPLNGEASEPRYRVIKIIEGTSTTVPEAGGINQKGQVVGSIDVRGSPNFWLWSDGVRQDLPLGNGRSGLAHSINNLGQVVGDFLTGDFIVDRWGDVSPVYHAYVWTDGSLQDLGTLGGWGSLGLWINDQGVVVGASSTNNSDGHPFITRDGRMLSIQSLISNPTGWKLALEPHYVAADGRIWGLGSYPSWAMERSQEHIYEMTPETNGMYRIRSRTVLAGLDVAVYGFNEYGQAAGFTFSSERVGAFLWDEQGLALLGDLGLPATFPYAINNLGKVAGMSMTESEGYNAFLWENGTMFNLNDLIPLDSGIVLTKAGANAINDAGQIVCTYRNVTSGFYGACLLDPVTPVPLEITRHELTQAGLELEVCGGAGQPLALEYTSDWAQWTTLATSTNLFARRFFIDPNARDANFRAYRARLVTP